MYIFLKSANVATKKTKAAAGARSQAGKSKHVAEAKAAVEIELSVSNHLL